MRPGAWPDYFRLITEILRRRASAIHLNSELPILPVLLIRSESIRAVAAQEVLAAEDPGDTAWPGKWKRPDTQQLSRFLNATDWKEQSTELRSIVLGWFETLAQEGLMKRRGKTA